MTDSQSTIETVPVPSAKAMGKRVAKNNIADISVLRPDNASIPPNNESATSIPPKQGMQTRKRVLPSRSRRGGPGVGGCDVDIMILETRKRRLDSEPLIPPTTRFVLTTNRTLVPSSSGEGSSDLELNTSAYSRYFDRPEVQKACQTQETIQTPEYSQLSDDALVGGRFRPRNSDEELVDTSDAAYEKRHRKYETFEKRQRLREKEKLKHEQYKLKERIEQLRAMETSAFLALPATNFSEPLGVAHEGEYEETDPGLFDLPGAHVNGAATYNEGERRRREMLEIAEALEDRYRVLLPPDRKWQEKKEKAEREKRGKASASASVEPQPEKEATPEQSDEDEQPDDTACVSLPALQGHEQYSGGESEVDFDARDRERSKKLKLRIPPRPPAPPPESLSPLAKKLHHNSSTGSLSVPGPNGRNTVRASDGRFLSKARRIAVAAGESISVPPRKRPRTSSVDPVSTPTKSLPSGGRHREPCILLVSAMRNAATQNARKTQRHVTAFGVRVPPEIEEVRDYEPPYWILGPDEEDEESNGDEGYEENAMSEDGAHSDRTEDPTNEREWDEDMKAEIPMDETLED